MRCPYCGADDTRVVDSRPVDNGSSIRRRRACETCENRFTTYERREKVLSVRKRDGRIEPFDIEKVRAGVANAFADRPPSDTAMDDLLASVEVFAEDHGPEVSTEVIGRRVLEELRGIDEVAYLRFASVYKEFEGASDFEREMAALEDPA